MDGLDFKNKKDSLVKASSVRSLIIDLGGRSSPEFITEIERVLVVTIKKSYERAKENGRNTVMRKDV
jgi:histone H3/H4